MYRLQIHFYIDAKPTPLTLACFITSYISLKLPAPPWAITGISTFSETSFVILISNVPPYHILDLHSHIPEWGLTSVI